MTTQEILVAAKACAPALAAGNMQQGSMYVNTPNIAALIVLVLSVALAFATPYALVATALALGFLVFRVLKALKEYPQRVNAALANLNACMEELGAFRLSFQYNRKKKDDILRLIESI